VCVCVCARARVCVSFPISNKCARCTARTPAYDLVSVAAAVSLPSTDAGVDAVQMARALAGVEVDCDARRVPVDALPQTLRLRADLRPTVRSVVVGVLSPPYPTAWSRRQRRGDARGGGQSPRGRRVQGPPTRVQGKRKLIVFPLQ